MKKKIILTRELVAVQFYGVYDFKHEVENMLGCKIEIKAWNIREGMEEYQVLIYSREGKTIYIKPGSWLAYDEDTKEIVVIDTFTFAKSCEIV